MEAVVPDFPQGGFQSHRVQRDLSLSPPYTEVNGGTITDWALPRNVSFVRWNGASAGTIDGIMNGAPGRTIFIENVTGMTGNNTSATLTLAHNAGAPAVDGFWCPNQSNVSIAAGANAILVYSAQDSRWLVYLSASNVPVSGSSVVGAMMMWGTTTAPTNYLLCDGSAVSRSTYSGLFAVIGTTYGTGDGSTTFNVPDLRQRFPLGKAAAGTGNALGGTGGAIDHTHSGGSHSHTVTGTHSHDLANHTHSATSVTTDSQGSHTHDAHGTAIPDHATATNTTTGGTATRVTGATHSGFHAGGGGHTHTGVGSTGTPSSNTSSSVSSGSTDSNGAGTTGSNNPPYLVVNYIICYQ